MKRKTIFLATLLIMMLIIMVSCAAPVPQLDTVQITPTAAETLQPAKPEPTSEPTLAPTPEPAPEPTEKPSLLTIPSELINYPEGMYKVGTDLPPSTYFFYKPDDSKAALCSVIVKDGSGSDATPLVVESFNDDHTILTVAAGQYVDVNGANFIDAGITQDYLENINVDYIPQGAYLVGFHLPAGEYKTIAEEGAVLSSLTIFEDATQLKPLDVKIVKGSGYVTLKEGECVRLRGVRMEYPN